MVYDLITAICLGGMLTELLVVVVNIIAKKRQDKITYIRSFKKGKCAIIFIFALPLLIMASIYNGKTVPVSIFKGIENTVGLVFMKYDFELVRSLMSANTLFNFTMYFTYVLVTLNAVMFTISLANQSIWRFFQSVKADFSDKNRLYLFGLNDGNKSIYKSDNKSIKTIIDNISKSDCDKLYLEKIVYTISKNLSDNVDKIISDTKKHQVTVVINTNCEEENISLCKVFVDKINGLSKDRQKTLFHNLSVFAFGNPKDEAIYNDIVNNGYGCIHYVNKYQKIAIDFINKYPFTKFMDERQIDFSTSLVKKNVNINVFLIGFGDTNRQIFLTSVANNQFIYEEDGEIKLKKVNYHIFDKEEAENNKNLNHNYYRYKCEFKNADKNNYLPLPDTPANEEYHHLDINDFNFYDTIKTISTKNKDDINFIIIAFGSDLENMDMAQKLEEKKKEWGIKNLIVFTKMRAWKKEQTLIDEEDCYFIGNEKEVIYNIDSITRDKIFGMAKMRNEIYDLEHDITHNDNLVLTPEYIKKNREEANENWYKSKSQLERESSIYGCLSIRSKLNMMGLDYCDKDDDRVEISEKEYMEIYAENDMPDTTTYSKNVKGKPIVHYTLDFKESRRKYMAIQEHFRWNSFMISKGIVPSSIDQIKKEITVVDGKEKFTNGRNYELRRHGNLTTFDGLVTFRKIIATRDNISELNTDVIKYDYQLLDDAYYMLKENGFKIVYKEQNK